MGNTPTMASTPMTMNATIASTLMLANQNSASPYKRTDRMLSKNTSTMNAALHTHADEWGNHRCMSNPAAVNSEASATAQLSQ